MPSASRLGSLLGLGAAVALAAAACSSSASSNAPVASGPVQSAAGATGITLGSTNDPNLGAYLTGAAGMTLYILKTDTPDVSTCTAGCASTWPPLTVSSGAAIKGPSGASGAFATIQRADGTFQLTYDHRPLYYYSGDTGAGQTRGQGIENVWFVAAAAGSGGANPAATAGSQATAAAPATPVPTTSGSGYSY